MSLNRIFDFLMKHKLELSCPELSVSELKENQLAQWFMAPNERVATINYSFDFASLAPNLKGLILEEFKGVIMSPLSSAVKIKVNEVLALWRGAWSYGYPNMH